MSNAILGKISLQKGIEEIIHLDGNLFCAKIRSQYIDMINQRAKDIQDLGCKIDSINTDEKWIRFTLNQ